MRLIISSNFDYRGQDRVGERSSSLSRLSLPAYRYVPETILYLPVGSGWKGMTGIRGKLSATQ